MLMVILSIIGVVILLTLINLKRGLTITKDGKWYFKNSDGTVVDIDKRHEDWFGK
jgi:hypothetical protein